VRSLGDEAPVQYFLDHIPCMAFRGRQKRMAVSYDASAWGVTYVRRHRSFLLDELETEAAHMANEKHALGTVALANMMASFLGPVQSPASFLVEPSGLK
jgi:hypothetical protein